MKKFYFIFSFIVVCISCSSDSSSVSVNPNLLQRVDFFPGTISERRWLFNDDGLLTSITKADGTIVGSFTYDSHNRLISSTTVDYMGTIENHSFTYDSNDFVTTVDGVTLIYNSSLNGFYTGNLNSYYSLTILNSEKLLTYRKTVNIEEVEVGVFDETVLDEMIVSYGDNGNILGYSPNESCNYLSYDDKANPLRNATLAICKAFAFISNSNWVDGQYNSTNNVLSHDYCSEDPESEVYHYTYNTNNLPIIQTRDDYYLGAYEATTTSAKYYYQGDVIP